MRSLHEIRPATLTAWVWAQVRGQNGHVIGRLPGATNWDVSAHAFQITRDNPPPFPEEWPEEGSYAWRRLRDSRRYWHPWSHGLQRLTTEERLSPLCGRFRSRSRNPRIEASDIVYNWVRRCLDCDNIAVTNNITVTTVGAVANADPWRAMIRLVNTFTDPRELIDPVTGL